MIGLCCETERARGVYRGKAAGLPADKVEALLSGQSASFSDMREQVVYEMATCLSNSRWVSRGLFDRAVEALGHEGITDVICLMGFYTSVSMTLAFLRRAGRSDRHGALSMRATNALLSARAGHAIVT